MLVIITVLSIFVVLVNNNGEFAYTLDDAYIHMAIAKNIAQSGTWGMSTGEFASASSSPLWTIILSAVYFITGPNIYTPLILNTILASLIACFTIYFLTRLKLSPLVALAITGVLVFITGIPWLIFTGMEHLLQIVLTSVFLFMVYNHTFKASKKITFLALVTTLLVIARYESLLIILPVIFTTILLRKLRLAFLLTISTAIPVALFGFFSIANGAYFLPNSVLLKGIGHASAWYMQPDLSGILSNLIKTIYKYKVNVLLAITALTASFVFLRENPTPQYNVPKKQITFTIIILILVLFGFIVLVPSPNAIYWFYRHSAVLTYVSFLSAVGYLLFLCRQYNRQLLTIVLIPACLTFIAQLPTATKLLINIPQTSRNIYQQQVQMAYFLKDHYQNPIVVANDIGAISYYSDINLIDIYGLGSQYVTTHRLKDEFDTGYLSTITTQRNPDLIMIYASWFKDIIPNEWIKVATWKIPENIVAGSDTVTFYATTEDNADTAKTHLKQFTNKLPTAVIVNLY